MSPHLRGLVITVVLAITAGFIGVGVGKVVFDRPHQPPTLHEVIHDELQLTTDQSRQIASLEAAFATRRQALER